MAKQDNEKKGRFIYLIPIIIIAISLFITARPRLRNNFEKVDTYHTFEQPAVDSITVQYQTFDPNTADYRTLVAAGVPRNIAVNIIKYREAGKIFRIKEDLALCYGMTDSLFFLLKPYITIGQEYAIKRYSSYGAPHNATHTKRKERHKLQVELTAFCLDSVGVRYLTLLGFSQKQAELIIRYREIIGGYDTFEEFEECYAVDSIMASRLRPYIIFKDTVKTTEIVVEQTFPIEINGADEATLIRINGIGPKSAKQIVRYRELLGGYYSTAQISELKVVTTENFERILPQIWCDNSKIKKININFAAQNELETHPYLSSRMLKRIINKRQLKGGWSTIEEMIEDNIFSAEEATRIAPYLQFGTHPE